MSVVSSDDAPEPLPSPLPLSSLFLTHWPATCSLFLLPITRSSVFCASCYMSLSLVIKNALWLSHVLVYWIKENPNIIVINTNNITIHLHVVFILVSVVSSIGLAIARRLSQDGAKVMISSRKQKNVDAAVQQLRSENLQVSGVVCHVSKQADRVKLIEEVTVVSLFLYCDKTAMYI